MTNTRDRAVIGKLVFWGFIAAVFVAITLVVVRLDRDSDLVIAPDPAAPALAERDEGLLEAESPNYPGEGAAGLLEGQENAGGAVNPITPTGRAGGPAGQTPAYGQPGGVPSRVVSQ